MDEENIKWFKLADHKDELLWQPNNLAITEVGGKKITLAKSGNQIFACAHRCPHASAIIADGFIDAKGNIVCPLHRYKFSLLNGRNVSGEGYFLKVFTVEERDNGMFVAL